MTPGIVRFAGADETRRRRRARVAGIKEAIRSGRYFVSAEDVARSLCGRLALLHFAPQPRTQTR